MKSILQALYRDHCTEQYCYAHQMLAPLELRQWQGLASGTLLAMVAAIDRLLDSRQFAAMLCTSLKPYLPFQNRIPHLLTEHRRNKHPLHPFRHGIATSIGRDATAAM
jgi:hypothetical protein